MDGKGEGSLAGGRASHYGAKDWNSVTARKLSGVLAQLKTGKDVFFIDLDIALVTDPVPVSLTWA